LNPHKANAAAVAFGQQGDQGQMRTFRKRLVDDPMSGACPFEQVAPCNLRGGSTTLKSSLLHLRSAALAWSPDRMKLAWCPTSRKFSL
jgi:hypothetical protein